MRETITMAARPCQDPAEDAAAQLMLLAKTGHLKQICSNGFLTEEQVTLLAETFKQEKDLFPLSREF